MVYLFYLLLILSPVEFALIPDWILPSPELSNLCKILQIGKCGNDSSLRYEIYVARREWRDLRNAPRIEESLTLSEHWQCLDMQSFWSKRVDFIERHIRLFGGYRHVDFEDALRDAKYARRYWEKCSEATYENGSFHERRLALAWLKDQE